MNPQKLIRISKAASLLLLAMSPVVFGDMTSASYQIAQEEMTGGAGSSSSSSYQIGEGSIRGIVGGTMSSSNYSAEGKTGVGAGLDIPVIQSISPGDISRFYTDQSASFTVTASTPNGSALQYQAKQDGTSKAGPQSSSTVAWTLGSSDRGKHNITLLAASSGGTTSQTQTSYFFRRPVK